ncbi:MULTISPECIES: membrane-bound lytic murein transglycosylase MltF [Thioalkalivibrio]|uniref:membrane-bound lytic murein transglycosylase MltF n=1 Tax=Thioalkalivibrio TaxID=106633 RepID=UPI00037F1083|nr:MULTISPECIES: membrane-bound lytic murein transglycosylase MltF [Thioalkalivibrio]
MGTHLKLRPPSSTWRQIELGLFIVLLTAIVLRVYYNPPAALEQLTFRDELRVALVERPLGRSELAATAGRDQLELELLHGLAEELGTRLRVTRVDDAAAAHRLLRQRRIDIAAGLLVPPNDPSIEAGPEILSVQHVVVFWNENERATPLISLTDIPPGARVGMTAQAPIPESLSQPLLAEVRLEPETPPEMAPDTVTEDEPALEGAPFAPITTPLDGEEEADPSNGELVPYANAEALREALERGEIDYAVMNSLEYRRLRRIHPSLRLAHELERSAEVRWLFPTGLDRSLIDTAEEYIDQLRDNRELELLLDRYLGHLETHDLVDALTFARRVEHRLEEFRPLFEEAGETYDLDWRFIAAVAYQESHWNPDAVSPTGVRGLMMLTQVTAAGLGIEDRTDPAASVDGGTRYLIDLRERLPDSIPEPDRTWMTLAAYNVGLGHLHDARRLAAANGDDPDRWLDVMQWLPRLAQSEWYEQTRYGYARGWEPVHYVQNIRSYYDKLVQRFPESDELKPPAPELYRRTPLAL